MIAKYKKKHKFAVFKKEKEVLVQLRSKEEKLSPLDVLES